MKNIRLFERAGALIGGRTAAACVVGGRTAAACVVLALLAIQWISAPALAQAKPDGGELTWPKAVKQGADTLTMYQPQIEKWSGLDIIGQAAVSVQAGEGAPVFGVARLTAAGEIDKAARAVTLRDFKVTRITFATAPEMEKHYLDGFRGLLPAEPSTLALDRLENSIALTEDVKRQLPPPAKSDVPAIIFTTIPTILVLVDGAPVMRAMPGLNLERVANTRALIVRVNNLFWLTAWDRWYESAAIEGPWLAANAAPAILERARQAVAATNEADLMASAGSARFEAPPVLRVSTVPVELIQLAGPPQMLPVAGTNLLQVRNTRQAVFVDLKTNLHYAQLSGHWYRTKSPFYGPWESVPAEALPADFARIPPAAAPQAPMPLPPVVAAQPTFPPPPATVTPPVYSYDVTPPPPPPLEVIPTCPGPGYVWTGGYWGWGARGWIWVGGRWGLGLDVDGIGVWFGPGYFGHGWRFGGHGHRR